MCLYTVSKKSILGTNSKYFNKMLMNKEMLFGTVQGFKAFQRVSDHMIVFSFCKEPTG